VPASAYRLRPVESADVPTFFEHQLDAAASALAGVPGRDRAAHERHWEGLRSDPRVTLRAVLVPGPGGEHRLAGYLTVFDRGGQRELGYWYGREFWGRGIATVALARFLEIVDERPLVAHVVARNPASAVVLLRCGFTEVGQHADEAGFTVRDFRLA